MLAAKRGKVVRGREARQKNALSSDFLYEIKHASVLSRVPGSADGFGRRLAQKKAPNPSPAIKINPEF